MEIKELRHVVLYVRNLATSSQFYGGLLGWREVGRYGNAAVYSSGRTHHELLLIEVDHAAAAIPHGPRVGLYHFGLKIGETDDALREAVAQLRTAKVTIIGTTDHGVTHSVYILDPDGNEIELYIDVQSELLARSAGDAVNDTKPLRL